MALELTRMSPTHIDAVLALLTQNGQRTSSAANAPEDLAPFIPPVSSLSVVALEEGELVGVALGSADGQALSLRRSDRNRRVRLQQDDRMTKAKLNAEWHRANRMPRNASLDQRVQWHQSHRDHCGCREMPESIRREIARREGAETRGSAEA